MKTKAVPTTMSGIGSLRGGGIGRGDFFGIAGLGWSFGAVGCDLDITF